MKDFSYIAPMDKHDPVRTLIAQRIRDIGTSMAEVSKKLGKNHAYLQQFLERGVPINLPETVRAELAPLIGVDEQTLRGPVSQRRVDEPRPPQNARIVGEVSLKTTIPVYGHAVGGKDGQFVLNGNKVTDILAPASLSGVPNAYAVYVVGDSMVPRYYAGEAVYVNPRLPVRRDHFVVAQIAQHDGEPPLAYVKQFISMDEKRLRLRQFNPAKTLEFPTSQVESVHKIIMGGDG